MIRTFCRTVLLFCMTAVLLCGTASANSLPPEYMVLVKLAHGPEEPYYLDLLVPENTNGGSYNVPKRMTRILLYHTCQGLSRVFEKNFRRCPGGRGGLWRLRELEPAQWWKQLAQSVWQKWYAPL